MKSSPSKDSRLRTSVDIGSGGYAWNGNAGDMQFVRAHLSLMSQMWK
jgi:hypothetical protein